MRLTNSSVVSSRFSRLGLVRAMIACSLRLIARNECAYYWRTSPKLSWFLSSALRDGSRLSYTKQLSQACYCQEHQTPFKRYSPGENVWYSHRMADGKWYREK